MVAPGGHHKGAADRHAIHKAVKGADPVNAMDRGQEGVSRGEGRGSGGHGKRCGLPRHPTDQPAIRQASEP